MGKALERCLGGIRRERGRLRASDVLLWLLIMLAAVLILLNAGEISRRMSGLGLYLKLSPIRRGLIVGALVSLCASLLGVSLVLKRFSMIGDGLSHVGFGALSVAMALGYVRADGLPGFLPEGLRHAFAAMCTGIADEPLPFALIIVTLCAFLLLRTGRGRISGDAAIAMLSTCALAVGVITVGATSGMNKDVSSYMFGSITSTSRLDVAISVPLSCVVLALFILFYPRIFAVTFDESFARATGTKVGGYNLLLALLTAITVVIGMRLMGTMLISCLIIFPALTSMRLFSHFRTVTLSSAIISVVCFLLGMLLSMLYNIPTGACIVAVNLFMFMVFSAIGRLRR